VKTESVRPAKFGLDTSCLVPLLAEWHTRHRQTVAAYQERLAAGQRVVIAAHALLECFAVLTRLPGPLRTTPQTALRILELWFGKGTEICGLSPQDCWSAMGELAGSGRGGGRVYDAVIARATGRAGASVLLTWNVSEFLSVAPPGLEIREP